jgi:hypothetical protein
MANGISFVESCQRDVPKSLDRGSDDARGGRAFSNHNRVRVHFWTAETAKWAKVIKLANIKVE